MIVPGLSGLSWSPNQPLTLGDNYTWWVGVVGSQAIAWSSALSFRVAPIAVGPSGPGAGSLPTFTWKRRHRRGLL